MVIMRDCLSRDRGSIPRRVAIVDCTTFYRMCGEMQHLVETRSPLKGSVYGLVGENPITFAKREVCDFLLKRRRRPKQLR